MGLQEKFLKRLKEEQTYNNIRRQWALLYSYCLHSLQSLLKLSVIRSRLWSIIFKIPSQGMKYLQPSSSDQEKMAAQSSTHFPRIL